MDCGTRVPLGLVVHFYHWLSIIIYYRPNWFALVKSCISVNNCLLLIHVRRHFKYVWFTEFTKFWGDVKNGPIPWDIQKLKLSASDPLTCPGTRWGLRSQTPERFPSSKFAIPLTICSSFRQWPTKYHKYGYLKSKASVLRRKLTLNFYHYPLHYAPKMKGNHIPLRSLHQRPLSPRYLHKSLTDT